MNRPDLMALLGHRVTITTPNGSSSWTGKLVAVGNEPCATINVEHGPRLCLPQSFTITPADDTPPAPQEEVAFRIETCQNETISGPDNGHLVGARVHGWPDMQTVARDLATLRDMITGLQAHIDQRAQELAQPLIAEAHAAAFDDVKAAQAAQQRAEDLVTELRRQLEYADRHVKNYRQRAEQAEAANARMRKLIDSYPPGSNFVTSGAARLFRDTLDGPLGQTEGTPA